MFSQRPNDRIRYDNFDDRWAVNTRPHHLHPRNRGDAADSPMIGSPDHDIPILVRIILQGEF